MRLADFEGKKIAIVGLGREGRAARNALAGRFPGQACSLLDESEPGDAAAGLCQAGDKLIIGPLAEAALDQFDVLILSPGISRYRPELVSATRAGVVLTSGSQVWFSENPGARCICVSGTKGKSTTASLVAWLIKSAGRTVQLAGNIGTPLLDVMDRPAEFHVIELSSYQLASLDISPEIGVLVSFYPEHLAWHGGEERYLLDKLNVVKTAGTAIVNGGDSRLCAATASLPQRRLFNIGSGYYANETGIYFKDKLLLPSSDLPLRGVHNAGNVCAALCVVECLGLSLENALIALRDFESLPHRLQSLAPRNGISYVDDSIATTPFAALAAIKSLTGQPITQLLGGYERGVAWDEYFEYVRQVPPNALICMGQNGPRIFAGLQNAGVAPSRGLHLFDELPEAFTCAQEVTPRGGMVLLSPGAPSFPEFRDFEHRGAVFAELIERLGREPDSTA